MERIELGGSGLMVAPWALGGNVFGWTVDDAVGFRLLDAFVDKGFNLIDTPGFPEAIAVEARPAANALDWLRKNADDLDWAFVSPSMMLGPGERTGKFRKGKHHLLVAEDGKSSISYEDLSVAVLDELETPSVHADRFTVGY